MPILFRRQLATLLAAAGLGTATWAQLPAEPVSSVGGLAFGQRATDLPKFTTQFRRRGRPRLQTQLYQRPGDTTRLWGLGPPADYWFRAGRFEGVEYELHPARRLAEVRALLTRRFGPPVADTLSRQPEWYWLGQRSYLLLSSTSSGYGSPDIGSLAMLNEYIVETTVRAAARQRLGWQPDSVGLPRQWKKLP